MTAPITEPKFRSLRLLFISTPVGPLGSGLGGGVELTIRNLAQELISRGHSLEILAPLDSRLSTVPLTTIPGELQPTAQTQLRTDGVGLPKNAVLANMLSYGHQVQANYDLIINFAYDWLPFYLTPWFKVPIAHFISMGSLTNALDEIMEQIAQCYPNTIGVYTRAQAQTFPFASRCHCLGSAVDLSLYKFCDHPGSALAWMGRISPEKGVEDAVAVAQLTGKPLKILGKLEDKQYWQKICRDYPDAPVEYLGFLPTNQLQKILGQCEALLMTHRWVEAFGNVAIEALACGVPVIAYNRGGPSEIVQSGKTGWLVQPDSVTGLVQAVEHLDVLSRSACRKQVETQYSLTALGNRFEKWFRDILSSRLLLVDQTTS